MRLRVTALGACVALLLVLVLAASVLASTAATGAARAGPAGGLSRGASGAVLDLPPSPVPAPVPAPVPQANAEPTGVRMPAIDLVVSLERIGLDGDGALEVPSRFTTAGWYVHGPRPGDLGPAVIAGHVDSHSGPAAFFDLGQLEAGDEVFVDYEDGTTTSFVVQRVERHPKAAFPTDDVYGDTKGPELRLITCGGSFDQSTGHYRDNVIVWASGPMDARRIG